MPDYRLITERCILRKLSHDDEKYVLIAARTPGFTDGMRWSAPNDPAEMHAFTAGAIERFEKGERYVFTIEDKNDGAFIGRVNIRKDDDLPGNVWTFGYWILPERQRQGYATEAVREIARFAFEDMNADAIVANHADWNEVSGKVMQKIGMTHIGFSMDHLVKNGVPVRTAEYRLDKNDWIK